MIDLDELERLKKNEIARDEQSRESVERQSLALHRLLPDFVADLFDRFIALAKKYDVDKQPLSPCKWIEISRQEFELTLSRQAARPYASLVVTCAQHDSSATVTCMEQGHGTNGELERVPFEYTLKAGGDGVRVFRNEQLCSPELLVTQVMRQFIFHLL